MKSFIVHILTAVIGLLLLGIEKLTGASNRVHFACPTVFGGVHYNGVSIRPGVKISTSPMPCVAGKTLLSFDNGNKHPKLFVENISSVEEGHGIPFMYLDIKPE